MVGREKKVLGGDLGVCVCGGGGGEEEREGGTLNGFIELIT